MRGRRSSAAEIEGWVSGSLEPLEDDERTVTQVGSSSVARALMAIRLAHRAGDDDASEPPTPRPMPSPREIETMPAPPDSDVREIGAPPPSRERTRDPLALYVEALNAPANALDVRAAPRPRRETVALPSSSRLRHATVPMLDRPLQIARPAPAPVQPEKPRSGGAEAMIILSFVAGVAVTLLALLAFVRLE